METKEFSVKALSHERVVSYKWLKTWMTNVVLLVFGIGVTISGLVIQCHYHLLKNECGSTVCGLCRSEWNNIHVWTSVVFGIAAFFHVWAHQKWYKHIFTKRDFSKYRPTLSLSLLMLVVAVSGFIPWLIYYFDGSLAVRISIVEVHDKVAILFVIIAFCHTVKRWRWYVNVLRSKL